MDSRLSTGVPGLDDLLGGGLIRGTLCVVVGASGIGMLVRYLTTAKQSGGAVRLLKPSKFTVQTLKMVGLLNLFSTFEDSNEAVASFQ